MSLDRTQGDSHDKQDRSICARSRIPRAGPHRNRAPDTGRHGGRLGHTDYSENGSTHWLEHVQASPNPASERQLAPYGHAAPAAAPGRVIVVGKETRYVNVEQLETVAIRSGDQTVNWTFDTMPRRSFPLSKIIPGTDGVTVYVAESPLYSGR